MSIMPAPPKVLLWGGSSKARIVAEMLSEGAAGEATIIFDNTLQSPTFKTTSLFTNDIKILKQNIYKVTHYVTCIGSEHGYARYKTSQYLERIGLKSISLIHDRSFVEPTATIGEACQIMPFAVVHKFVQIGSHTILNTNSTVDHECVIGKGVHIMGSAAIAGKVEIGDYATIGTNATILPGLKIGEGAFIGAGAVVNKDVEPYMVVAGVPARNLRRNELKFFEELLITLTTKEALNN